MILNHDARARTPEDGDSKSSVAAVRKRKLKKQLPQESIKQYWDRFNTKYPGLAFTVLPDNQYAKAKAAKVPKGAVHAQYTGKSYDEARAECVRDVQRIIKECRRTNRKYRDPHFDIEWDLKSRRRDCLEGLSQPDLDLCPKGVKRVTDIFEQPQFYVNGPTAGDVRQGRDGDCYLMAALCGLGNMSGLIDRICVIQHQAVGVYGFVFHRDGEWQQCIIDDKLYMIAPDYDEAQLERAIWNDISRKDTEEEYRKAHQTGSRALYFAQCSDENETWLPLLEKAFAKAHGDFASIDGGFTGEAIEDLTGGVTSEFFSTDILDKDEFWHTQLRRVGKDFLFGCATGYYSTWLADNWWNNYLDGKRKGIIEMHAYSIMDAVEIKGERLLKLRNPWGEAEWTGKWSDGSEEWTPEWMQLLDHRFGNDGIFWISYEDLLQKYQTFDRTRIFGPEWLITQQWTSVHVPWSADYLSTKFSITITKYSPVVIVLSQLDRTYFRGLEGAYWFTLQFRVEKDGGDENDYIVRSNGNYAMSRSVSTDIALEAGTYLVLMKITAYRTGQDEVEDVIPLYAESRREKLIQIGLSHDLANAKGVVVETEKERGDRKAREKAKKIEKREKKKKEIKAKAEKMWIKDKKRHDRTKKAQAKKQEAEAKRRPPQVAKQAAGTVIAPSKGSTLAAGKEKQASSGQDPVEGENSQPKVSDVQSGDSSVTVKEPLKNESSNSEIIEGKEVRSDALVAAANSSDKASAAEMAGQITKTTVPTAVPSRHSAEDVVQSLAEVIAIADAESPSPSIALPIIPKLQADNKDAITNVKPMDNQPPISASAATDMTANPNLRGGDAAEVSDADSYPDFDWQSDLDMESESDYDIDSRLSQDSDDEAPPAKTRVVTPAHLIPAIAGDEAKDEDDDAPDPWNAVCVVGLRVYSQDPGLVLRVVRPRDEDDEVEATLDRDDPAKGAAVAETPSLADKV